MRKNSGPSDVIALLATRSKPYSGKRGLLLDADHDEFTMLYARTSPDLDRVSRPLIERGFRLRENWKSNF